MQKKVEKIVKNNMGDEEEVYDDDSQVFDEDEDIEESVTTASLAMSPGLTSTENKKMMKPTMPQSGKPIGSKKLNHDNTGAAKTDLTDMGKEWPRKQKNTGGSHEDAGGAGRLKEDWSPNGIANLISDNLVPLSSILDVVAKSANYISLREFNELCIAYGHQQIDEQMLKHLLSTNRQYVFVEHDDAQGKYWTTESCDECGCCPCECETTCVKCSCEPCECKKPAMEARFNQGYEVEDPYAEEGFDEYSPDEVGKLADTAVQYPDEFRAEPDEYRGEIESDEYQPEPDEYQVGVEPELDSPTKCPNCYDVEMDELGCPECGQTHGTPPDLAATTPARDEPFEDEPVPVESKNNSRQISEVGPPSYVGGKYYSHDDDDDDDDDDYPFDEGPFLGCPECGTAMTDELGQGATVKCLECGYTEEQEIGDEFKQQRFGPSRRSRNKYVESRQNNRRPILEHDRVAMDGPSGTGVASRPNGKSSLPKTNTNTSSMGKEWPRKQKNTPHTSEFGNSKAAAANDGIQSELMQMRLGEKQKNTGGQWEPLGNNSPGKMASSTKKMYENISRLAKHIKESLQGYISEMTFVRGSYPVHFLVSAGNLVRPKFSNSLTEAAADAEELLQVASKDDIVIEARFIGSDNRVIAKQIIVPINVQTRGPIFSENRILFRFPEVARDFADTLVSEGKTCRAVTDNWGAAVTAGITESFANRIYNSIREAEDHYDRSDADKALRDPNTAYYYARNFIRGRWKEAEPVILRDPEATYYYWTDILNYNSNEGEFDRWEEAEPVLRNSEWWEKYKQMTANSIREAD